MDDVISKLAEIELAASKIMENVAEEKKSLSLENEARIKAFDDEVDKKTEEKLEGIRKGLEVDMEQELLLQKQQTEATLKKMEAGYEQRVEAMVQELYDKILRMCYYGNSVILQWSFNKNPSDAEPADDRKTISGNRTDGIRDTGSCIFKKTAWICKAVGGSR